MINYQKHTLHYGNYRIGRVIWITDLKGETNVKLHLLDQKGNLLYRITGSSDESVSDIIYERISQEQIADIQRILSQTDPFFNWYDDDLVGTLGYFGRELAKIKAIRSLSKTEENIMVEYELFSSKEERDTIHNLECFEIGEIDQAQTERRMLFKLIAHEEMDAINVKYYEAGEVSVYRLVCNERTVGRENEND